jgi:hypothetical protein
VQLSPDVRADLLLAAGEHGFDPPSEWFDHPALGAWLSTTVRSPQATTAESSGDERERLTAALTRLAASGAALRRARAQLTDSESRVTRTFVERATPALADLERTFGAYLQLARALEELGIAPVEPLGATLDPSDIDSERHEIVGPGAANRFVVREGGIVVNHEVVRRATLAGESV